MSFSTCFTQDILKVMGSFTLSQPELWDRTLARETVRATHRASIEYLLLVGRARLMMIWAPVGSNII